MKNRAVLLTIKMQIAYVPLTKGKWSIIDASDMKIVAPRFWHAKLENKNWYAATKEKKATMKLHQLIWWGGRSSKCIDHIDRNGLNNRHNNLRSATRLQNTLNRAKRTGNFRGVQKPRATNPRWAARIGASGKLIYLGTFDSPEEAARAYDKAALAAWGDDAPLNFPPPGHRFCGRRINQEQSNDKPCHSIPVESRRERTHATI